MFTVVSLKSVLSILQAIQRMSALISEYQANSASSNKSKGPKLPIFSFQRAKFQKQTVIFEIFKLRLIFA